MQSAGPDSWSPTRRRELAEVLGRYSNQSGVGSSIRALLEVAALSPRKEPWAKPKLVGTTCVRCVLASELHQMISDYEAGIGCVVLSRRHELPVNTVLARLKEAGVAIRRPATWPRRC